MPLSSAAVAANCRIDKLAREDFEGVLWLQFRTQNPINKTYCEPFELKNWTISATN